MEPKRPGEGEGHRIISPSSIQFGGLSLWILSVILISWSSAFFLLTSEWNEYVSGYIKKKKQCIMHIYQMFKKQCLQNNPYWFWWSALCTRIKRFSPVLSSGTAMVIYVKFQSLLLFLSFWDDHSPCWFSKCSKAGSASSTLKKTKIIIWFRRWRTSVWMTTVVG